MPQKSIGKAKYIVQGNREQVEKSSSLYTEKENDHAHYIESFFEHQCPQRAINAILFCITVKYSGKGILYTCWREDIPEVTPGGRLRKVGLYIQLSEQGADQEDGEQRYNYKQRLYP